MSAPIGPGDWVECIGGTKGMSAHHPGLVVVGQIYQVKEVGRFCRSTDGARYPSLTVFGVPDVIDGYRVSLPVVIFRPIYSPKAELITNLLTTIPAEPERIGVEA